MFVFYSFLKRFLAHWTRFYQYLREGSFLQPRPKIKEITAKTLLNLEHPKGIGSTLKRNKYLSISQTSSIDRRLNSSCRRNEAKFLRIKFLTYSSTSFSEKKRAKLEISTQLVSVISSWRYWQQNRITDSTLKKDLIPPSSGNKSNTIQNG